MDAAGTAGAINTGLSHYPTSLDKSLLARLDAERARADERAAEAGRLGNRLQEEEQRREAVDRAAVERANRTADDRAAAGQQKAQTDANSRVSAAEKRAAAAEKEYVVAARVAGQLRTERDELRQTIDGFASRAAGVLLGPGVPPDVFERKYLRRMLSNEHLPGRVLATVNHSRPVTAVAFAPFLDCLFSGDDSGGRIALDLRTVQARPIDADPPAVAAVAGMPAVAWWTADRVTAVATRPAGGGALFLYASGAVLRADRDGPGRLVAYYSDLRPAAVGWTERADRQLYVVGSRASDPAGPRVREWPVQREPAPEFGPEFTRPAWQPVYRLLAAAQGSRFAVRDLERSREPMPGECADRIERLEFHPSQRQLACVTGKGVELWNCYGQLIRTTTLPSDGHPPRFWFHPRPNRAVTVHADGIGYLWDTFTGRVVLPLGKASTPPLAIGFGADGRLLTCSADGNRLFVWDGLPGDTPK